MMPPKNKFADGEYRKSVHLIINCHVVVISGERVLCFHGPLLYEAKVSTDIMIIILM